MRLISPPLFFVLLTYQVWPDESNILLDYTDSNPNGWQGRSSSRATYTNGTGAEIYSYTTYNYSGASNYKWSWTDLTQVTSYDGSNIPSDITKYSQFRVTSGNTTSSSAFTTFYLEYATSTDDTGTMLCNNRTGPTGATYVSRDTDDNGYYRYTYTLLNQYTSKPYILTFGNASASYEDQSDRWHYYCYACVIRKIELLE